MARSKEGRAADKAMRDKWMRKIGPEAKAYLQKAVDDAAEEVAQTMRRTVPVRSGDLRNSIQVVHYGWKQDNANVRGVEVGTLKEGTIGAAIVAGDKKAWYARLVEFSTARTPAQPFFWPSWRAHKKDVRKKIAAAWRAVFKAGGKAPT